MIPLARHDRGKALTNIGVLAAILLIFVYRAVYTPDVPLIDAVAPASETLQFLVLLFLLLCQLRLWLGVNLVDFDLTVRAALRSDRAEEEVNKKKNFITVLKVATGLSILAFNQALGSAGLLLIVLGGQVLLLATYDIYLREELLLYDIEKSANKFIFVGDIVAILFTITIGIVYFDLGSHIFTGQRLDASVLLLLGAFLAVFVGEIWAHYFSAVCILANQVFRPEKTEREYAELPVTADGSAMNIGKQAILYSGEDQIQPILVQHFLQHIEADKAKILEVGYGRGYAANAFRQNPKVASHKILEIHPGVIAEAERDFPSDQIIRGDWRDKHPDIRETFHGVYFDTNPLVDRKIGWSDQDVIAWVVPAIEAFFHLLQPRGVFCFIDLSNRVLFSPAFIASKNKRYVDCTPVNVETPTLQDRESLTLMLLRRGEE